MAAKKSKSENYLSVENLGALADAMTALEEKSLKKWNKKPAIKRGEDLQKLIETKFSGIGDEATRVAVWVDLYIYVRDLLVSSEDFFAFMEIDEAIGELIKYEKKNPGEFEYIHEWVADFGCLLTEGRTSDIGAWFHDWIYEPLDAIGALAYADSLYLNNPTKAQLGKLAKSISVRDRVQAALESSTDANLLEKLAQDSSIAVRLAVAKNSSTPERALDTLSRDPEEVVAQTALSNDSISIESIESSTSVSGSLSLARSKKATSETLAKLAKEKDEDIRAAVAANENTAPETLLLLAKDKSDDVRENVADNPNCPMEAMKILVKDKNYLTRSGLAMRDDLDDELRKILSKDEDRWVRERIAENKFTSHEILLTLSKDPDSLVRDLALKNENLRDDAVGSFENPIAVRLQLAENPSTPLDLLEQMSLETESIYYQGKTSSLMMAVASNPSIPETLMGKLMKSKNNEILNELAANPSLTENYLNELVEIGLKRLKAGKTDWSDRDLELGLAKNPHSPASYLTALLKHSDSWVVAAVAENPNLPPDKLAKLAKSENANIRKGVASNPSASWVLLQSLSKDQECMWQIAQNPATRAEELLEMASKSTTGPLLLADIMRNPSAPHELLKQSEKHKDAWVRLGVASNPNTPKAITKRILEGFQKLKNDEDDGDLLIIRCEATPPEMIQGLFEKYLPLASPNRSGRLCGIGTNPNTGPDILTQLADDRFSEVRIAVASNQNTPVDALRKLSQ